MRQEVEYGRAKAREWFKAKQEVEKARAYLKAAIDHKETIEADIETMLVPFEYRNSVGKSFNLWVDIGDETIGDKGWVLLTVEIRPAGAWIEINKG